MSDGTVQGIAILLHKTAVKCFIFPAHDVKTWPDPVPCNYDSDSDQTGLANNRMRARPVRQYVVGACMRGCTSSSTLAESGVQA